MAGAWLAGLDRRQRRLLALALACSVALHLGLLYLVPFYFASQRKAAPAKALTAHLEASKPAPPSPTEGPPQEPAPAKLQKPSPKPAVDAPAALRALEPGPQAPAPEAAPVAAPPPAAAGTATAIEAKPESTAAAPAARTPDPGSVTQYRLALIEIARRHKRYPRVAIDNNWEGRTDLRMVIDASGALASLSVRKSAGHAALDEEAMQMFRAAKSQAPVPPALRGKEFALEVSADFYLVRE